MKKSLLLLAALTFALGAVAQRKTIVPQAITTEAHDAAIAYHDNIDHGTIVYTWYYSKALGTNRRMAVYLPPSYFNSQKNYYPVLYLLHGTFGCEEDWLDKGHAATILDYLLSTNQAREMIIVMPNTNMWQLASPKVTGIPDPYTTLKEASDQLTDGRFEESFSEIISATELRFRTINKKDSRAIAGLSRGGFFAFHISHYLNAVFNYVGMFSPTYSTFRRDKLGEAGDLFDTGKHLPKVYRNVEKDMSRQFTQAPALYWIAIGKDDFLYKENTEFRALMETKGYPYQYYESAGGHSWENWQYYLQMFLPCIFK